MDLLYTENPETHLFRFYRELFDMFGLKITDVLPNSHVMCGVFHFLDSARKGYGRTLTKRQLISRVDELLKSDMKDLLSSLGVGDHRDKAVLLQEIKDFDTTVKILTYFIKYYNLQHKYYYKWVEIASRPPNGRLFKLDMKQAGYVD